MTDRTGQSALQCLSVSGTRRTYSPPVSGGGGGGTPTGLPLDMDLNWNSGIAVPQGQSGYVGGNFNTVTGQTSGQFIREATSTQVFAGVDNPGSVQSYHTKLKLVTTGDYRVEIASNKSFPLLTEIWYGFAYYPVSTTTYNDLAMVFQTHHANTYTSAGADISVQVPFAFYMKNGEWNLWTIFHEDAYSTAGFPNRKTTRYQSDTTSLGAGFHSLTYNTWTRWVFRIIFDPYYSKGAANLGRVTVYKNGLQVADILGAIGIGKYYLPDGKFNAGGTLVDNQNNIHVGIYASHSADPPLGQDVVEGYHGRLRVGVGLNRYADVAP